MIKLVLKSCVLIGLVSIAEGFTLSLPVSHQILNGTYLDAWSAKHRRLLGPGQDRIILAGGSNLAFGVDSSRLETVTGRQTINLGLHAGLGLAVMLNEIADGARAGDLVIVVPEYEQFYGDVLNGEETAAELVVHDRSSLRYFSSWRQWGNLFKNAVAISSDVKLVLLDRLKTSMLGRDVGVPVNNIYRSSGFDEHGDLIAHLDQESRADRIAAHVERIADNFNPRAIDALAECAETLSRRGVAFVMLYPPVAGSYWAINQDLAERVAAHIPARWARTIPTDWVFEDALFFDTPYHLNRSGRDLRTGRVVRVLQAEGVLR